MEKVELGDKAEDKVSGFVGIVYSKHIYLNGCIRFSIIPKVGKDGILPEIQTFDAPQLKILKKKVIECMPIQKCNIELGDKSEDIVTGFSGIVSSKHFYLDGSIRLSIQPPINKKGIMIEIQSFDVPMLKVLKKGVIEYIPNKLYDPPGGPNRYIPKDR